MKKLVFDYNDELMHPSVECKIVDEKDFDGFYSIPLYSREEILAELPPKDFNGYRINIKTEKPLLIQISADSYSGEYNCYTEIKTDYAIDEDYITIFKDKQLISLDLLEEKIYEELDDILIYEEESMNIDLEYDLDNLVDTAMNKIKENAVICYVIKL